MALPSHPSPEAQARIRLRRAVRSGEIDRVRALLDAGVDPNDWPSPYRHLAVAAENGSAEMVELLVWHGADPAWVSPEGWSAATHADANDFDELASRLVQLGSPPGSRQAHGYTQLHRAARRGDVEAALDSGSEEIDALDAAGDTPLALAVEFRQPDAVAALLTAGANPNHLNDEWSILAAAVYEDSRPATEPVLVDLLLAAGADVNSPGYPPLLCAVNQEWSSGTMLARMVAAGADIGATGGFETVLHRIACMANASLIDIALNLGAEIGARDSAGRTPLLVAAESGNTETFIRLAERGADIYARDDSGRAVEDLLDDFVRAGGDLAEYVQDINRIRDFLATHTSDIDT